MTSTITDDDDSTEEDTVTLQVVAVDSAGVVLGDGSANAGEEEETLYYKVIAKDPAGNDVTASLSGVDVAVEFVDGTARVTDDYVPPVNTTVGIGTVFSADLVDDFLKEDPETYTVGLVDAQTVTHRLSTRRLLFLQTM